MIKELKSNMLDSVMKIWLDTNIDAHNFIPKEFWHNNYDLVQKEYMPNSTSFVYEENSEILAFISIMGDNNYIGALFVNKDKQGRGIGKTLLTYCKTIFTSLELEVYEENLQALNFYKSQGFEVESKYNDDGHIKIKMTWKEVKNIARVIAVFKGLYKLDYKGKEMLLDITGNMKKTNNFPVVGDLVALNENMDIIKEILPRKSKLSRKVAGSEISEQILVSNIDYIFIVSSLNYDFNLARLERYLTMAYESGAKPVFILTKSDIGIDIEDKILELEKISFGLPIHTISLLDELSLGPISKYFEEENIVTLVGSSGVGKSSLINKLLGREILETKEIREDDSKGRHTTTHRELFYLNKGAIIDTPGMRELQLWGGDLSNTFEDILELSTKCKFKNCSHNNEPACAVRNAIENGKLSEERFNRYLKLQKELAFIDSKQKEGFKRAEKQKVINMMGSLNARKNIKKEKK